MHSHIQVCHRAVEKLVAAADHTRGCHAKLNVILSHWLAIKHGAECHGLKNLHWGHLTDAGDLIHGGHGDVPALLLLCKMQERNHGTLAVTPRKLGENNVVDLLIARSAKVPQDAGVVSVCVVVPHLTVNETAGGPL
ncbi:NADH:ubiquinone reductase (H(+)-translocating)/NADH dehydrogenase [Trypanosoma rangeli]|uniref:NADH:ubiquinone reductase (H(+)-translocating)/NADH dehydrogenase n=1 Tax=Trypanosoma rangeli TaxID=5698 RepID=A0A3R7LN47_TRYRA|nr:NADH:ubiquinone reductase (H(+)-translocating)/NADH dehydrogenase [Trypanosoma rangeli]RNF00164.1 NADH:ubiquinone reductase (H(+)-translocating)/NADH dehydrogenase [Trypanosoma rangeli]|eukprot:RNF00164.1 NADH:ubiquinone reductase (H(+)-translocating)/NADH dehydrogenase [Trypanosoma rangeli]